MEGWLRKVEGETHLLQGPLWELLPLPDQIWQPRGWMGRKADEAQELFQELWERCPLGISHGDRMLQNQGLYILLPDTDREKLEQVWPREVEGEEDFVFGGAAIPQPPQDRHNPVPAVALENSHKCPQDSQDCPKSTLSHFISQN